MPEQLHIIKLSVDTVDVADLAAWQAGQTAARVAEGLAPLACHVTRMWPRRAAEILPQGSIYWVIRGVIRCRQHIAGFSPVTGADGITRCAILLTPDLILTDPRPRAAFQGWRYLTAKDAPEDLDPGAGPEALPESLRRHFDEVGLTRRRAQA